MLGCPSSCDTSNTTSNTADSLLKVYLERWTHGALDVHHFDVLPVLLQQGGKKVAGKLNVEDHLLLRLPHVADGDIEAHDLLHLELDGCLQVVECRLDTLARSNKSGELPSLRKARPEKLRDLLDERVGRQESIVPWQSVAERWTEVISLWSYGVSVAPD